MRAYGKKSLWRTFRTQILTYSRRDAEGGVPYDDVSLPYWP
jgi:hypothetical protein